MIFAFVSLRAGTVGGLPNRNSKRLFSRTSNEISKKAVRFSLEVDRCRKAPRHQLFSEFFAKAIKMPSQFVYGGGFQVLLSSHIIPQSIGKRWHSKSVCAKAHKGSNPFLSATKSTVIYYGGLFLCHKMLNNKNFRLFRYIVPPLWNYSAAKMVRFTEHELIQATQTM